MITHDTSVDYDVDGNGPPLILIGGLGFGRWGWFKQIPALSRHFRTITFDVRGPQNLSRGVADLSYEVTALLDHLGIRKAHVLGASLGGFVAQELALERPDVVNRLVLVCTSYGNQGPEPVSPQALGRMLGWGSFSAESAARRGLETATSDAYRAEHPEEFEQLLHWRLADSPSTFDYYQQMMAGARFDGARDAEKIASPTLVIHGADDQYVPVANAAALAEAIPEARLRILDDAGHLVFIERAEEVNEEIVSFLRPRRPWRKRRPLEPPAKRKTVALTESWNRLSSQDSPVTQKTRQIFGRAKELTSFLKPRIPEFRKGREFQEPAKQLLERTEDAKQEVARKAKEGSVSKKLGDLLRRSLRTPGDWARKLRDRLSR